MGAVRPRSLGLRRNRLLLVVTGAIGARHSPAFAEAVRGWYPEVTVRVLVTDSALRFVTRSLLEVTSRQPVVGPDWDQGHELPVPHRELAEWADVVVVCPASGNTVARLAAGISDSLALATIQDAACPVIIAPGVSPGFATRRIHQQNVRRLRESDYVVLDPVPGLAASDGSVNPTAPPSVPDIMMAVARSGQDTGPRRSGEAPDSETDQVMITVYAPRAEASAVRAALAEFSTGAIGHCSPCAPSSSAVDQPAPVEGHSPHAGSSRAQQLTGDDRIEVVVSRAQARRALDAMKFAHPNAEPTHQVVALLSDSDLP